MSLRKLAAVGVVLACLSVPAASFAQTISNNSGSAGSALVPGLVCPTLLSTISIGAHDWSSLGQVSRLQKFLAGYFGLSNSLVTGYFGAQTQNYVIKFQAANSLEQVGSVGKLTRAAIASACSGNPVTTVPDPTAPSVSCVAPHITQPSPLPGYSIGLSPGQNGTGQSFVADQSVTYSLINSPTWVTLSDGVTHTPNSVIFGTVPTTLGTYNFTIVATNGCGKSDTETIPVIISNGSAAITQSSLTSSSGTPTISGTSQNVSAIAVTVSNGDGVIYNSDLVGVSGGNWSTIVSPALSSGTYPVVVTNYYSHAVLATGTLTVTGQAGQPSLTFIAPNANAGQSIAIGDSYQIMWRATPMPSNAFIEFDLVASNGTDIVIPQSGPTAIPSQGSYRWVVQGPMCPAPIGSGGCIVSLQPGQYQLVANVYTGVTNNLPSGLIARATSPWITLTGVASGLAVPSIDSFTASPTSITQGQSSTLAWSVSNLLDGSCKLTQSGTTQSPGKSAYGSSGSLVVSPSATATYTLSCTSSMKDGYPVAQKSVTVSVGSSPAVSATLNYVSQTPSSVNVTCVNMPPASQILFVNATSGARLAPQTLTLSGNGTYSVPISTTMPTGSYYLLAQTSSGSYLAQTVTFYISNSVPVVVPTTASIDSGALASTAAARSLTGSASGTTALTVIVYPNANPDTISYRNNAVPVVEGGWSVMPGTLSAGTYTIEVHKATQNPSSSTLLAHGQFTVAAVIAASAAIDPNVLSSTAGTRIVSGSATGVTTLTVLVYSAANPDSIIYRNTAVPVVEGGWTVWPSSLGAGIYVVEVHRQTDSPSASTLLTSGQFRVAGVQSNFGTSAANALSAIKGFFGF